MHIDHRRDSDLAAGDRVRPRQPVRTPNLPQTFLERSLREISGSDLPVEIKPAIDLASGIFLSFLMNCNI
ncbi:MAG: hypothetical protein EAZ61_02480 [Oscillatoriales cyanobacterium]|nr:MAG: hypothetical protein EAZ61_02480 [Oscillatoriales cyanobacterium]